MAMLARRYMIETGATEMDLGAVAIAQRRSAQLNPRAILRDPLTPESYLAAEWIAEPYRVPDCTTEVDGACAVVVTSVDRAKSLKQRPAVIKGAAYGCGPRSGLDIGDSLLWSDYSRNFTSVIADSLWTTSGMTPGAVDFAQIYDCFTGTVLMGIEGLGFASRGKAGAFIRSDSLPINTNGGLLCEGYLHGMNTVAEAVLQLQGRASNQLDQARVGVVTSGGFMDGSALVLSAG
jgi:acetyl-CoA acetyltransferase